MIERIVAAFAHVHSIPDYEQKVFRNELALALMTPPKDESDVSIAPDLVNVS